MRYLAEHHTINNMGKLIFKNEHSYPVNLQLFLHKENGVSKKLITRLKRQNSGITRNGELIRTIDDVYPGDIIVVHTDDEKTLEPNGELSVRVVFENDSFVVFDKPQKMPVHPSINHYRDTLGNYFSYLYPGITFRPVNRLDRNTSGLCVVAKNQYCAYRLQNNIRKVYYAIVSGIPQISGTIDAPIARQNESMITRCVSQSGQRAVTHYELISSCGKYSYVKINLETGRTHQIRVHFSYIGHPLAGDDMYGGCCDDTDRQALCCGEMSIFDEKENQDFYLSVPPNDEMKKIFEMYNFK